MNTDRKENQESDDAATAQNNKVSAAVETVSDEDFPNELNESRWSVISFDKIEAKNLTYDEAAQKLKDFAAADFSGLCIVTDEAAERILMNEK